jgi:hypothetical protein
MPYVCSCDGLRLACGFSIAHTDLLALRTLLRLLQITILSSGAHHAASASHLMANKHVGAPHDYQCNVDLVMLHPFAGHADLQTIHSAHMSRHMHSFCYAENLDDCYTSDPDASFRACLPVVFAPGAC